MVNLTWLFKAAGAQSVNNKSKKNNQELPLMTPELKRAQTEVFGVDDHDDIDDVKLSANNTDVGSDAIGSSTKKTRKGRNGGSNVKK